MIRKVYSTQTRTEPYQQRFKMATTIQTVAGLSLLIHTVLFTSLNLYIYLRTQSLSQQYQQESEVLELLEKECERSPHVWSLVCISSVMHVLFGLINLHFFIFSFKSTRSFIYSKLSVYRIWVISNTRLSRSRSPVPTISPI